MVLIFRLILPRTKQKVNLKKKLKKWKKWKWVREKYLIESKTSIYEALSLSLAWLVARVLGMCLDAGIKSGRCVFFFFFVRENWSKCFLGMAGYCFVWKNLPRKICNKRGNWFTTVEVYVCELMWGCGPLDPTLSPKIGDMDIWAIMSPFEIDGRLWI